MTEATLSAIVIERLFTVADAARTNAYAPYSQYRVGAALLTRNSVIYLGVNVENASYGLTMCAERVAIGSAVAAGETDFSAIAVSGPDGVVPCGACRQVLAEFAPMAVIYGSGDARVVTTIAELLPQAFSLE